MRVCDGFERAYLRGYSRIWLKSNGKCKSKFGKAGLRQSGMRLRRGKYRHG